MEDETLFDSIQNGIILKRGPNALGTNVPHHCVHHSPTGFEWGYAGSGPADLALNIVESALLSLGYKGPRMNVWRGQCFDLSFHLHQAFKFQFIATANRDGAVIPWEPVLSWVKEKQVQCDPEGA